MGADQVGKYILTFDVPDDVISKALYSRGIYVPAGYEEFTCTDEYAIESSDIDIEYLTKVEKVLAPFKLEDFLPPVPYHDRNGHIDEKLETVWEKGTRKM